MSLASNLHPLSASGKASNTTPVPACPVPALASAAAHPEGNEPETEDARQNPRPCRWPQAKQGWEQRSCLAQPMKPWSRSPTSTSDRVHHGLGTAQPASATTDLCPPSMGSPQKPEPLNRVVMKRKTKPKKHTRTHENSCFQPTRWFFCLLSFPAQQGLLDWLTAAPGQAWSWCRSSTEGRATAEPAVSILPGALLLRQLTVLAWTGMHRVGGSQGAPTAAPQQPQAAQSLPQTIPFASPPQTHSDQQPPHQRRNPAALGQSRSVLGGDSSSS